MSVDIYSAYGLGSPEASEAEPFEVHNTQPPRQRVACNRAPERVMPEVPCQSDHDAATQTAAAAGNRPEDKKIVLALAAQGRSKHLPVRLGLSGSEVWGGGGSAMYLAILHVGGHRSTAKRQRRRAG